MLGRTMNILAKNLLILASAGSGKTFQLGNRVIGLVAKGVAPEQIVALTFTRKAAGEFADSVLTKLAQAACDESKAAGLRRELALPDADFGDALERVVRALPRFTLGTMDSFFSKVVRGFQYELGLTGGKFDLLEGPRAEAVTDGMLALILGETLVEAEGDVFLHAFRRASIGREQQKVMDGLRGFVKGWQRIYQTERGTVWGPDFLSGVRLEDWEENKHALAARVLRGLDDIEYKRKGLKEAFEKMIGTLAAHTIGSGSLAGAGGLLTSVMEAAARDDGPLRLKYYQEFDFGGPAGDALRDLVRLAARCEMASALIRTRAVREVVAEYDARCGEQLRRRGLLGFDDVKILMGEWVTGENARLRREAVDFRLDARYEHWLLDEFQDTSRADWTGLLPLIDEAAGEGGGSVFVVGDRKQAIYAWRGGEVGLFDEVMERYQGGMEIESMAESWRSCPEVLALVNRICGDTETMRGLFGEVADRWHWQEHFSAAPLLDPDKRGEARVEVVDGKSEEKLERLAELLGELGVGTRPMTCGVLVRSNDQVRKVADELRVRGFDVIEEGRREPAKDNPVGVALWHLLKWLANPADSFAREVLEMSPLAAVIHGKSGEAWQAAWEKLSDAASVSGFAAMVEELVGECWDGWSDFGRRRAGDVIMALAELDSRGVSTAREAADWIERLEVSQSPGAAAVQVMTIHKSKGLGFDVVVLPEVPNEIIPQTQRFDVAMGEGWVAETPPKWARDLIPGMREAESRWADEQRYESFCMLYVALTRSKRGLYVLLEPPPEKQDADKPSLANWIARSIGAEPGTGVVYQQGAPDWVETIGSPQRDRSVREIPALAAGVPRRERITPAGMNHEPEASPVNRSASGMKFGTQVHAAFEKIGWIDEESPGLPDDGAGSLVAGLLKIPELRRLFERNSRPVECLREQPIDALVEGRWLSGVMDRLHLHRDANGNVRHVEVIDFKTDRVDDMRELALKHAGQMHAYREVMQRAYPAATVECILLSTACRGAIAV